MDEVQIAFRTLEGAQKGIQLAQDAMRDVQKFYHFNIQLDTEGKYGKSWKDCH